MAFDSVVTNPGRLRILAALARQPGQAFVALRNQTGLTDGNLATHARRLQSAGLIAIEKSITSGKPLTTLHLTREGRDALSEHAQTVLRCLDQTAESSTEPFLSDNAIAVSVPASEPADDWVD